MEGNVIEQLGIYTPKHITGMCMHTKHIKTFRPYTVIFLIKIVDGFKKLILHASPINPPPKNKVHTLQTYKCFEFLALESYCVHFLHGHLLHFLCLRQVLVTLFVMFVQCLYPLQDEDILIFQFVDSDKYFISLYHRYVAVSSFRKKG